MKLTIAFVTGRPRPRLDWMLDSLATQAVPSDEITVLVIDKQGRTPQELGARPRYALGARPRGARARSELGVRPRYWSPCVRVALPKPTPWQGPHRITACDWWAKSSAINTALVLCETDYIALVDDCCRLGPRWLETVRRGMHERRSVLAGTYDKIEHGSITPDHRRGLAPHGKSNCGGGWLYGCTFALPLAWALEVNGAEEGCDGLGHEDYILGFMLENNGHQIDFVPSMAVTQERAESSTAGPSIALRRADKGGKREAALARFRARKRTEFSPDLRTLRDRRGKGDLSWPMPDPELRDWFDGELVREM